MAQQPQLISLKLELQAVKDDLDVARQKIERYTQLVATLYDELDTLRKSVCTTCKHKILPHSTASSIVGRTSSTTPLWRRIFGQRRAQRQSSSRIPSIKAVSHPSYAEIPSTSSCTKQIPFEPPVSIERAAPPPVTYGTVDEIANGLIASPDWSVTYNHEIEQILNVNLAHTLKMKSQVLRVNFSRQGKSLAVGLESGEIYIYDTNTFSKRVLSEATEHPVKEKKPICAVQFTPDDKCIAVGGSDGLIKIWNIAEKRVLATFEGHESFVFSVAFSRDGRYLVSGSLDSSVRVWRMRDGSSRKLSDANMSGVTSVALSPDSRYVAASNDIGMLRMWDFRSGQLLERWKADTQTLWSVVFTPDGKGLLSGGNDSTLRSWDIGLLTTGQSRSSRAAGGGGAIVGPILQQPSGSLHSISILPEPGCRWVVSCSNDTTVYVWDIQTGTWYCTLNGHQSFVMGAEPSPDGHYLATGAEDGLVRIWRYEKIG